MGMICAPTNARARSVCAHNEAGDNAMQHTKTIRGFISFILCLLEKLGRLQLTWALKSTKGTLLSSTQLLIRWLANFLTDLVITCFNTFGSTSVSFLMYRQDLPVLYLPSRSISGARSNPGAKYKVRSPLRGEKAAIGHSPSRPLSYLWRNRPKPTMLPPHIAGSSLVTSRIISRTA